MLWAQWAIVRLENPSATLATHWARWALSSILAGTWAAGVRCIIGTALAAQHD